MLVLGMLGELDRHDTGDWHPERPARLEAVRRGIADALGPDGDGIAPVAPRAATQAEIVRVHSEHYVWSLEHLAAEGGGELDPDTPVSAGSWDTATYAAGAGLAVIDELAARDTGVGFVAVRPPGHHARPGMGMGFCLLNNVAISAAALAARGERVLIVDWDVHHGNGTQDVFWDDPEVLYVSTHQWPAYPGTGRADEVGGPAARGATLNVPLPPGATGDVLRRAFDLLVTPTVESFAPTWVLVSAGFDAHRGDPLADLALSAGDFADLAATVAGYAPDPGRLVLFLEGGYDLGALQASVAATLGHLVGAAPHEERPTAGGPGSEQVDAALVRRRAALDAD